eukprot:CAMPEP_0119312188 /NCGR_PEP_ID=MMETSP1333-20130426/25417_1 /TAXON_ID=418940 /ORGANISM="Scyphosphaera apsteinii, Strain RCC1455" /LENGTH=271 /DNA_ID=CAMNT_0007316771 /DNA_START=94 /DNA_END=909 /DNA_ORIENTATION=-
MGLSRKHKAGTGRSKKEARRLISKSHAKGRVNSSIAHGEGDEENQPSQDSDVCPIVSEEASDAEAEAVPPPASTMVLSRYGVELDVDELEGSESWLRAARSTELEAKMNACRAIMRASPSDNAAICTCEPHTLVPSWLCRGWHCYAFEIGACERPEPWFGANDGRPGCGNYCMHWHDEPIRASRRTLRRMSLACEDCGEGRYLCYKDCHNYRGIWSGRLPARVKARNEEFERDVDARSGGRLERMEKDYIRVKNDLNMHYVYLKEKFGIAS